MSSQTVCCGCNVFKMAKISTGLEIGLSFILFFIPGCLLAVTVIVIWMIAILLGPFVMYWAYLATEFIGIHKKVRGLIIFSCVIRVILSILDGVAIIVILIFANQLSSSYAVAFIIDVLLVATVLEMLYLIFKTWIQFKVLYAERDNATFNNTI